MSLEGGLLTEKELKERIKELKERCPELFADQSNDYVGIELKPAAYMEAADYYLSLIGFLIEELSKYTKVEVYHKEILDEFRAERARQWAKELEKMLEQKQRLDAMKNGENNDR